MNPVTNAATTPAKIPKKFKSYPNSLNKSRNIFTNPLNTEKNLLVKLKIKSNPDSKIPPATEDLTCGNPITTLFIS